MPKLPRWFCIREMLQVQCSFALKQKQKLFCCLSWPTAILYADFLLDSTSFVSMLFVTMLLLNAKIVAECRPKSYYIFEYFTIIAPPQLT